MPLALNGVKTSCCAAQIGATIDSNKKTGKASEPLNRELLIHSSPTLMAGFWPEPAV
jgi:hypothetical protein